MKRRIVGGFPEPIKVQLIVLEKNFGRKSDKSPALTGLWNQRLKDGTTLDIKADLRLDAAKVVNHGKQLFVPLKEYKATTDGQEYILWMNVYCVLHGHVLPVTESEGKMLSKNIVGAGSEPPFALVILRNLTLPLTKKNFRSLAVVDRTRLSHVTFFEVPKAMRIDSHPL